VVVAYFKISRNLYGEPEENHNELRRVLHKKLSFNQSRSSPPINDTRKLIAVSVRARN
jgi:hypothetical protein